MEVAGVDLKVISGLLVCGLTTSMKTPLRQTG